MSLMSILTPNVAVALIALYATLATATGIVWGMARANPAKDRTELKLRVRSWWVILLIFSIAIAGTKTLSIPFLTFVSFLSLKEFPKTLIRGSEPSTRSTSPNARPIRNSSAR